MTKVIKEMGVRRGSGGLYQIKVTGPGIDVLIIEPTMAQAEASYERWVKEHNARIREAEER